MGKPTTSSVPSPMPRPSVVHREMARRADDDSKPTAQVMRYAHHLDPIPSAKGIGRPHGAPPLDPPTAAQVRRGGR